MIAVTPVFCSTAAIVVDSFFRYTVGKEIATIITARTPEKIGAKACVATAAAHWPLANRVMAVVKPHPGQVIPAVARIGHCHPFNPLATRISWMRPIPKNVPINQRFNNNGPSTGVKNHSKRRDVPLSPEGASFLGCPCAGLYDSTILVISTCNWCSGWQNAYLRYRHLWGKLYGLIEKKRESVGVLEWFDCGLWNLMREPTQFYKCLTAIRNPKSKIL